MGAGNIVEALANSRKTGGFCGVSISKGLNVTVVQVNNKELP